MLSAHDPNPDDDFRRAISAAYLSDDADCLQSLLPLARVDGRCSQQVQDLARHLVSRVRLRAPQSGMMEAFIQEYDLSTQEGVVLMCMAEALLRSAMSEYVKTLNEELKLELERKFASMHKREIQLAAAELSTRG